MLARKICVSGLVDLESIADVQEAIVVFRDLGLDPVLRAVAGLDSFDIYILKYFFEGLSMTDRRSAHR
jgi:hypothetical protein